MLQGTVAVLVDGQALIGYVAHYTLAHGKIQLVPSRTLALASSEEGKVLHFDVRNDKNNRYGYDSMLMQAKPR